MAVVSVNESLESRSGGDRDDGNTVRYRTFIVETNDLEDEVEDILDNALVPQPLDDYEHNGLFGGYLVVDRRARQDENPYVWWVEVTYSNQFRSDRLFVDVSAETYRQALEYDITGNPIINSASELFVPATEIERYTLIINLTRDENVFDVTRTWNLLGSLNREPFICLGHSFPIRTCLMSDIRASDKHEFTGSGQRISHTVTYTVKVRRLHLQGVPGNFPVDAGPWDTVMMDRGYSKIDPVSGEPVKITEFGRPIDVPKKLNGAGQVLVPQTDPPHWLHFITAHDESWPAYLNSPDPTFPGVPP